MLNQPMKTAQERAESAAQYLGDVALLMRNIKKERAEAAEIILRETGLEGLCEAAESLYAVRQRVLEVSGRLFNDGKRHASADLDAIVKLIDASLSKLTPPEA